MSATTPTATRTVPSFRQHLLDAVEREREKTMRVLRAYPRDQWELRPHPKCKTARELAFAFVMEQKAMQTVMTTGFDFSKPLSWPAAPDSGDAVVAALEEAQAGTAELLRGLSDEDLARATPFMAGPGKVGELPVHEILWTMTFDQIHHRGQFSIYLRMAEGKVPSIYGPSADEPWR
jgi:uncharacterized damage-inducible protein DinB